MSCEKCKKNKPQDCYFCGAGNNLDNMGGGGKEIEDYKKRLVEEIEKEIPDDWTYHDGKTIKNVVKDLINNIK